MPDISINVTLACCESRVVEHHDVTDSEIVTPPEMTKTPKVEEEEVSCFRSKRHAKSKSEKKVQRDGAKTGSNLL